MRTCSVAIERGYMPNLKKLIGDVASAGAMEKRCAERHRGNPVFAVLRRKARHSRFLLVRPEDGKDR